MTKGAGDVIARILQFFRDNPEVVRQLGNAVQELAKNLLDFLRKKKEAKTDKERAKATADYERESEKARVQVWELRVRHQEQKLEELRLQLELEQLRQRHGPVPTKKLRVAVERLEEKVAAQHQRTEASGAVSAAAEEVSEAADAQDEERLGVIARGLLLEG